MRKRNEKHETRDHSLLIGSVLFQVFWFVCVLSAPRAELALLPPALLAFALIATKSIRGAKRTMLALAIGLLFDTALTSAGLYFPQRTLLPAPLTPLWLLALWGGFGLYADVALSSLHGKSLLPALAGALFGPLAYASGERLGAIAMDGLSPAGIAVLAIAWSAATVMILRGSKASSVLVAGRTR